MATITTGTINLKLVNALFCKNCSYIDLSKEEVNCIEENCDCLTPIAFKSLVDFYANLYFHMNNVNLSNYETIMVFNSNSSIVDVRTRIKEKWKLHINVANYVLNEHNVINHLTIKLVEEDLRDSKTNEELIIKCIVWLLTIDNYLEPLRRELEESREPSQLSGIETYRGLVMFKRRLGINNYL